MAGADGEICTKCQMEDWSPIEAARKSSWTGTKFGRQAVTLGGVLENDFRQQSLWHPSGVKPESFQYKHDVQQY